MARRALHNFPNFQICCVETKGYVFWHRGCPSRDLHRIKSLRKGMTMKILRNKKGFTLLEILVATTLLATALLGLPV